MIRPASAIPASEIPKLAAAIPSMGEAELRALVNRLHRDFRFTAPLRGERPIAEIVLPGGFVLTADFFNAPLAREYYAEELAQAEAIERERANVEDNHYLRLRRLLEQAKARLQELKLERFAKLKRAADGDAERKD